MHIRLDDLPRNDGGVDVTFHRQPKSPKECWREDVLEHVRKHLNDETIELPTLNRLSGRDLEYLADAFDYAAKATGEA